MTSFIRDLTKSPVMSSYKILQSVTLLYSFVWGGELIKLQILGKNPSSSLNYYKKMTKNSSPILRKPDNFPPGGFYSTPRLQLDTKSKLTTFTASELRKYQKSSLVSYLFIKRSE